jgi:aspartate oxidase
MLREIPWLAVEINRSNKLTRLRHVLKMISVEHVSSHQRNPMNYLMVKRAVLCCESRGWHCGDAHHRLEQERTEVRFNALAVP